MDCGINTIATVIPATRSVLNVPAVYTLNHDKNGKILDSIGLPPSTVERYNFANVVPLAYDLVQVSGFLVGISTSGKILTIIHVKTHATHIRASE